MLPVQAHYARLTTHGPKRQLLGNQVGQAPPAWRNPDAARERARSQMAGSKIFISSLPTDVTELEVQDLFTKTIGPLTESFIVYNSSGKSKGIAVVSFQRQGDAVIARRRYDGKIVDGRRTLKVEIIVDDDGSLSPPPLSTGPSLLQRIAPNAPLLAGVPTQPRNHHQERATVRHVAVGVVAHQRVRRKKGPRRLKKSREQLDKEIEDYRAVAEVFDFSQDVIINNGVSQ